MLEGPMSGMLTALEHLFLFPGVAMTGTQSILQ